MACLNCGSNWVVNKRYQLCGKCNRERMYGENYRTKGQIREEEKREFYKEMDSNSEGFCKGCHTTQMLTHSHLIPVSRRKDLETNPLNVVYHCLTCHPKWESNDIKQMSLLFDFEENLKRIKLLDNAHYMNLVYKFAQQGYDITLKKLANE